MDITVEDVPQENTQSPVSQARTEPIAHLALAPRFNIDSPTKQEEGQLSEIWAYAKAASNSEDIQDVIWEVMHLEGVLGSPRLGESRLDRLYRYCKLKRQEATIQQELKNVAITGRLHR